MTNISYRRHVKPDIPVTVSVAGGHTATALCLLVFFNWQQHGCERDVRILARCLQHPSCSLNAIELHRLALLMRCLQLSVSVPTLNEAIRQENGSHRVLAIIWFVVDLEVSCLSGSIWTSSGRRKVFAPGVCVMRFFFSRLINFLVWIIAAHYPQRHKVVFFFNLSLCNTTQW